MGILPNTSANRKHNHYSTAARPVPILALSDGMPDSLKALPIWIGWDLEFDGKKWGKIPKNPRTGGNARTNDPSTWGSMADAFEKMNRNAYEGIAIVITKRRDILPIDLVGIDLDDCRDADTGDIDDWAITIIDELATYTEVSPSGTGVKLLCEATWPEESVACGRNFSSQKIEIYREKYWCMTGHLVPGTQGTIERRDAELTALWDKVQQAEANAKKPAANGSANGKKATPTSAIEDRYRKYLTQCEIAIETDNGSKDLMATIRKFVEAFRTDYETTLRAITTYYNPRCAPPWSDKDLRHAVDSIFARGTPASQGTPTPSASSTQESTPTFAAPIPLVEAPDVSAFPISVFPSSFQTLIEEAGNALNVPHDYLALPILALAGSAIANSRHIALTRSHTEPPCLYACIVGPPGTLKTPALKILRKPFDELQRIKLDAWQKEMDDWGNLERDARGPEPVLERVIVNDTTVETLALILHKNPRGVALIRDELSGLIASLNQYKGGKGSDKQFWLSGWSGDPIYIDRKTEKSNRGGPLHVYQPFVGIVGGIQPDILPAIGGECRRGQRPAKDGFMDRFAIAWPDPLPHVGERGLEISQDALHAWTDCIFRLSSLEMVKGDGDHLRPYFVQLDQSGRDEWKRFTDRHANEMNAESFPPHLVGPWSKLRGMTGRIALILHLIRWASDSAKSGKHIIDGLAIHDASRVTAYLKDHARRVHACMGSDPRIEEAKRVLRWIQANNFQRITKRDTYRQFRNLFKNADEAGYALGILERHYIIMPVEQDRHGPGRKPSPEYIVNPRISELDVDTLD